MKHSEVIKSVLAGMPLVIVEFRKTETDTLRRKAPKQGEAALMPQAKHTVLIGDVSFEVVEWLPDGADLSKVTAPHPRGARVVMELESMEQTKYGNRASGKFHGLLES